MVALLFDLWVLECDTCLWGIFLFRLSCIYPFPDERYSWKLRVSTFDNCLVFISADVKVSARREVQFVCLEVVCGVFVCDLAKVRSFLSWYGAFLCDM